MKETGITLTWCSPLCDINFEILNNLKFGWFWAWENGVNHCYHSKQSVHDKNSQQETIVQQHDVAKKRCIWFAQHTDCYDFRQLDNCRQSKDQRFGSMSCSRVVFKGPVAWTGKRPETGPNRTDLDWTAVAVALPFLDGWTAWNQTGWTNCNRFKIPLQNTFKMHLKTLKMIKIWKHY